MPYRLRITDSEVRTELSKLGYLNVSQEQVEEFRQDLLRLIKRDLKKLKEQKKAADKEASKDHTSYFDLPPPLRTSSRHETRENKREVTRERPREFKSHHIPGGGILHHEKYKGRRFSTSGSTSSYSSSEVEESGYSEVSGDSDESRRTLSQFSCMSHGSLGSYSESDSLNGLQDNNKDRVLPGTRPKERSATEATQAPKTITQGKIKRPQTSQGTKKGLMPSYPSKPDPVNLYHYYKQIWNKFPVPGEDPHSALRWETRTKLFYST